MRMCSVSCGRDRPGGTAHQQLRCAKPAFDVPVFDDSASLACRQGGEAAAAHPSCTGRILQLRLGVGPCDDSSKHALQAQPLLGPEACSVIQTLS